MKKRLTLTVVCLLLAVPSGVLSQTALPGLHAAAKILRDMDGIPHIIAQNEHDMIMMQGWVHAQDRLFQMDLSRRQASGTLAEVLGSAALGEDVQFRTFGLRRAAERSLAALSPELQMTLDAYADGVNAWVARHPLPPEYGILEITQFEPWTALDTVAVTKLLAFGLSFDLDIGFTEVLLTYQAAGAALGFNGNALFFEDLFRSAPFDPASTVPDAMEGAMAPTAESAPAPALQATVPREWNAPDLRQETLDLARTYIESIRGLPILERALDPNRDFEGSNEWAVSGPLTDNGRPLVANDPHLALNTPSTFYQIHLRAISDGFDVIGSGFPGAAYVVIGQNRKITWGATVNPMDVTDVYQESIVPDPASPSGFSTVYLGNLEPIIPLPQVFRYNILPPDGIPDNLATAPPNGVVDGTFIPAAVLIVPRRNNGPILALNLAAGVGISLQYTGFSATREADTFRAWNLARDLDDFIDGLQYFDVGSQNWVYGDVRGNIAYFTSAEMPVREDLQAGFIDGLPPYFIRNGTGGNEWLPVRNPQPGQAIAYEILPFEEMPKLINPPAGYFVNANNDPTGNTLDNNVFNRLRPGGGIFYLNPGYAIGTRAGRITEALEQRLAAGPVTPEDMEAVQADVVMLDAQVFTPYILEAFENARQSGADLLLAELADDPRLVEAIERLSGWDHTAPTGLDEGYDASDFDGIPSPPGTAEIEASVAATIYSVWRGQMIGNTIDATLGSLPGPGSSQAMTALRNLLDTFGTNQGIGASGLDFFDVPGVSEADTRRDIILLQSMIDALDLLAGPAFDDAFAGSTDQIDYRWGRLHRIVLDHPLGDPFDVPPAGGAFPPPLDDLDGIPVDGGFGVPDASSHSSRADSSEDFRFGSGPARRYVGQVVRSPLRIEGRTALPGGASGVLGSPYYVNLLGRWLTNDAYGMRHRMKDVQKDTAEREVFVPAKKRRRGPPVTR